jgi:hypothetical protein
VHRPTNRRPPLHHHRPPLAALLVAILLLGACAVGEQADSPPGEDVEPSPPAVTASPAPPQSPADEPVDPGTGSPEASPSPDPVDDSDEPAPLAGEPSTGEQRVDATAGTVAVTEVRVAAHDGFDRVVLEIAGDGEAGWWVSYVDAARTAGKGDTVPLEGDAVLSVAIQGATLPPELSDDVEPWIQQRTRGPGARVLEVAGDTVFEGVHGIFIGLDRERPFVVERLDDPQRVVVDVHDG